MTLQEIEKRILELQKEINVNIELMEGASWEQYKDLVMQNIQLDKELLALIDRMLVGSCIEGGRSNDPN